MGMSPRRLLKRRRPAQRAPLDLSPRVPRRLVDWENGEDGNVVLLVPRFRRGPLARLLQPRLPRERRHVRVSLDPLGSWVWRACDGLRNLAAITRGFAAEFPEQADPGARVGLFAWRLHRSGFLDISGGGEQPDAALLAPAPGAAGSARA